MTFQTPREHNIAPGIKSIAVPCGADKYGSVCSAGASIDELRQMSQASDLLNHRNTPLDTKQINIRLHYHSLNRRLFPVLWQGKGSETELHVRTPLERLNHTLELIHMTTGSKTWA
jgi:hypothetical protein